MYCQYYLQMTQMYLSRASVANLTAPMRFELKLRDGIYVNKLLLNIKKTQYKLFILH